MEINEFRKRGHEMVDWMADYMENVEQYPVKSSVKPKEILRQLPENPPDDSESFDAIFDDFKKIVLPGLTHWQHPKFMAFFPANSSPPSVLAEMLTATLGIQGMIWQTSPAATELEERVMEWLGRMIGLPDDFAGVIQDTASTATLCSILTAREKLTNFEINLRGFTGDTVFRAYCSTETHSSIEKDLKIAGLGKKNLVKIEVDEKFAIIPEKLEAAIESDLAKGYKPLIVVAATGTTGSTAIDPLRPLGEICRKHNIWLHVDAAFAGTALVLPEMRWMIDGIELSDTFVFNPHKWMFTNFDCSAYYVKDKEALIRTFEIMPEYLKTAEDERVTNFRDWHIQLGRRFRALKLWFVIRSYGVNGIKAKVRNHIDMAQKIVKMIEESDDFELLAPVPMNTICFRYRPDGAGDPDALNEKLLETVNATGKLYLTHTKLNGVYTIRLVIAQTHVQQRHADEAWDLIVKTAREELKA